MPPTLHLSCHKHGWRSGVCHPLFQIWYNERTKMPTLDDWQTQYLPSLLSGLPWENICFKIFRLLNLNLYVNLNPWREILCLWMIRLYSMSLCCSNFLKWLAFLKMVKSLFIGLYLSTYSLTIHSLMYSNKYM